MTIDQEITNLAVAEQRFSIASREKQLSDALDTIDALRAEKELLQEIVLNNEETIRELRFLLKLREDRRGFLSRFFGRRKVVN